MPIVPTFVRNPLDTGFVRKIIYFLDRERIKFAAYQRCRPGGGAVEDKGKSSSPYPLNGFIRLE